MMPHSCISLSDRNITALMLLVCALLKLDLDTNAIQRLTTNYISVWFCMFCLMICLTVVNIAFVYMK